MKRVRVLLAGLLGVSLVVLALATGPASATATSAKVTIGNQALLLPDGSAVLTVSYTCAPGPAGDTTGTVGADIGQGPILGFAGTLDRLSSVADARVPILPLALVSFGSFTMDTHPRGPITSLTKNATSLIIGPQPASYQPTDPSSNLT